MDPGVCQIDGFGPVPLITARSVPELGDLVRRARAADQAIYPLGGQTMLGYGLSPTHPGIAVDLRSLTQVIDYPARDMTITVQAGTTLATLQELLATENQRLPVDVPLADRATIGGALATNISGPRRYGFGTLRDYLIGITVVNDEGQEVKAGGRVVKNVAGYDLCKLYVGSLGTLGIITQVTLKLKPRPERCTLVGLRCTAELLAPLLDLVQASRTRPASISLLSPKVAASIRESAERGALMHEDGWFVLVGFEDNSAAVDWQVKQLQQEAAQIGTPLGRQWSDAVAAPIWKALADFPLSAASTVTFKANVLPRATTAFCQQAAGLGEGLRLLAHAGNGIVIGHVDGDLTLDRARAMLKSLHEAASAAEGNVVVLHCPTAWKAELPIWGTPRGDVWLMRAVKEKLDPRRLFNPGRFVDAL